MADTPGFDFGQFQATFDYLSQKLAEGGALTPEETAIYNELLNFAHQGLDLTGTGDFNKLYNSFTGLADQRTKQAFESLYGTGILGPAPDTFTRPGSVMEAFQRRGQSVRDGPAMAALAEGLRNYNQDINLNSFNAMTNAYQDMTPIRAQNLQATIGAGNIASSAAQRRVGAAGVAGQSGVAAGQGDVGGEGVSIDTTGAPKPKTPSFWDKYGGSLIGLIGTGLLGAGGIALQSLLKNKGQTGSYSQDELDRAAKDIVNRNPYEQTGLGSINPYPTAASNDQFGFSSPAEVNAMFSGQPMNQTTGFNAPIDQWWNQPSTQYNFQPALNDQFTSAGPTPIPMVNGFDFTQQPTDQGYVPYTPQIDQTPQSDFNSFVDSSSPPPVDLPPVDYGSFSPTPDYFPQPDYSSTDYGWF